MVIMFSNLNELISLVQNHARFSLIEQSFSINIRIKFSVIIMLSAYHNFQGLF